jgi:hypothetical protein
MIPRSRPPTAQARPRSSGRRANSQDTKKASASRWTIVGRAETTPYWPPAAAQPASGKKTFLTLGWPAVRRLPTVPPPPNPVTPVMLLIAIFSVTVLLLCWLCYSGESKR